MINVLSANMHKRVNGDEYEKINICDDSRNASVYPYRMRKKRDT